MQYVKYISETQIEPAPVNTALVSNYNSDIGRMTADGYKPLAEAAVPLDGKRYKTHYRETEDGVEAYPVEDPYTPEEIDFLREQAYRRETDGLEAELAYKTRKAYPAAELAAIEEQIETLRADIRARFPKEEML